MGYEKQFWERPSFEDRRIEQLEKQIEHERDNHRKTKHAFDKKIIECDELRQALDYLLQQTVDEDLKHGIGLTEGEEDARQLALAVIAKVAA